VAKYLMQTATTADYTFTLYAEDRAFTPAPGITFEVASWNISYRAQDRVLPGVVPSQMDLTVFGGFNIGDYRTMLADAKGRYMIEMRQGTDMIWRGFLVPDLCSIEVINGQRFIKLVFSDGFQMLDRRADFYQYSGTVSFTEQIWYAFENCNLFDTFEYFLVSQHRQPANKGITTNQGGLWWTGCIQNGLWILNDEYRTYLEVINDICVTFGLQLFQDKGYLVFRSLEYKTPAWYNIYGTFGAFVTRVTPTPPTANATVFSDGSEMYKPAVRELFVTHNKASQGIIRDESGNNKARDNYYVGNVTPTGANHIDFDSYLYMRLAFDAGFGGGAVDVEFYYTIRFGNYYWDGSNWTTTASFVTVNESRIFGPGPSLETIVHHVNNAHLDTLPRIGTEPLYYDVTGTQISGDPAETITVTATMYFAYHNANPNTTIYYADNTGRVNGTTENLNTEIGDIWRSSAILTALPGEIRCFTTTARTTAYGNIFWDTDQNLLISAITYELARKNYQPKQYYEIELKDVVRYNHTFTWGGVDYKPVNLQIGERSTSVTYAAWIDGDLETDPNSKRPDQTL
jgi:hypothetical protein